MNDKITSDIKNILLDEKTANSAKITITSVIDTAGITATSFASTVREPKLEGKLMKMILKYLKRNKNVIFAPYFSHNK